jgi:hypothetical protein
MGLGFVIGQQLPPREWRRARWPLIAAAVLLSGWLLLRLSGGYGNFVPFIPGEPWHHFFIMSKWPPSLDFFAFTLGSMLVVYWAISQLIVTSPPRCWRWLIVFGQASLFFYAVHLIVYLALGLGAVTAFPGLSPLLRNGVVWVVGLIVLFFLASHYNRVRRRGTISLLRYL